MLPFQDVPLSSTPPSSTSATRQSSLNEGRRGLAPGQATAATDHTRCRSCPNPSATLALCAAGIHCNTVPGRLTRRRACVRRRVSPVLHPGHAHLACTAERLTLACCRRRVATASASAHTLHALQSVSLLRAAVAEWPLLALAHARGARSVRATLGHLQACVLCLHATQGRARVRTGRRPTPTER